ncbi:MAG TPA: methyltransferase domain-containing protein [Rhodanobacteraceae bacterium]
MTLIDKTHALDRIRQGACTALELGCGPRKRHHEAVGIDRLDCNGVDLVGDVFEALQELPPASIQAVHAYHFFEHVDDVPALLGAIARVLGADGLLDVEVPHFSNPYFYSDPTHSKFFGLYTFSYWADEHLFRRRVPHYYAASHFKLVDVRLDFDSPFLLRGLVKRSIGPLFNVTRWLQEFYEENVCHALPCYQLRFTLRRLDESAAQDGIA